jgi:hypothetical protein
MSTQTLTDRISALKEELAALKKERKLAAFALKISREWLSVKYGLPDSSTQRAIVWCGHAEQCWWNNDKKQWFVFNGTWMLNDKDRLENVTHWMMTDWMQSEYWPSYGPGLMNYVRYIWRRFTQGATDMARDMRPRGWSSKAQLDKKPVFYRDASGKIMTGMPENVPAPRGYEKVVCGSVQEAERYSEMQRRQERVEHRYQQEQRGAIEESFKQEWRRDARTLMENARDNKNREFMRRALERNAERKDPTAFERESYLHAEAFEDRH